MSLMRQFAEQKYRAYCGGTGGKPGPCKGGAKGATPVTRRSSPMKPRSASTPKSMPDQNPNAGGTAVKTLRSKQVKPREVFAPKAMPDKNPDSGTAQAAPSSSSKSGSKLRAAALKLRGVAKAVGTKSKKIAVAVGKGTKEAAAKKAAKIAKVGGRIKEGYQNEGLWGGIKQTGREAWNKLSFRTKRNAAKYGKLAAGALWIPQAASQALAIAAPGVGHGLGSALTGATRGTASAINSLAKGRPRNALKSAWHAAKGAALSGAAGYGLYAGATMAGRALGLFNEPNPMQNTRLRRYAQSCRKHCQAGPNSGKPGPCPTGVGAAIGKAAVGGLKMAGRAVREGVGAAWETAKDFGKTYSAIQGHLAPPGALNGVNDQIGSRAYGVLGGLGVAAVKAPFHAAGAIRRTIGFSESKLMRQYAEQKYQAMQHNGRNHA